MAGMLKHYLSASRAPRYSVLLALPLLLLYEGAALLLTGSPVEGVRNGADVMLKSLFLSIGGTYGLEALAVLLLGGGALLVWRDRRRSGEPLKGAVFGWMLAESCLYAAVFGVVVGWLTAMLLRAPHMLAIQGAAAIDTRTRLVTSLGAGIYEELVFRVILVGALLWGFRVVFGMGRGGASTLAVAIGALVFSAFHYVGPYGDRFTVSSFVFRAIAGVVFSVLYVTRGIGITAWTHALYDVGLTLLGG